MSVMDKTFINLIIFSIIYGVGCYSYHSLRHYFAIKAMDDKKKKEIGGILIYSNIGIIIASLVVSYIQIKLSTLVLAIVVIVISVIAIIPLFKLDINYIICITFYYCPDIHEREYLSKLTLPPIHYNHNFSVVH